ncbi:MAG TPA: response regulator transcription factor [Nitrospira sp.]|nr:response regulator transcription factor [Nitrospira sp.]
MLVSVEGNHGVQNDLASRSQLVSTSSTDARPVQYRVLLVDDDPGTRQLLEDILEKYQDIRIVGQAGDGQQAVAMAIEYKPDVILMDIGLPYLDGVEATQCIRKSCPETVVICLTGHFSPPRYSAMRTAGAAAFVCKNQVLAIHEMILSTLGQWTRWKY